jgi:hypothetical protein
MSFTESVHIMAAIRDQFLLSGCDLYYFSIYVCQIEQGVTECKCQCKEDVCLSETLQVVLVLLDFILLDFALTQLENLHHFSNLHDNFRFNTIWHRRSMVALIFCRRLAGSVISLSRHQSHV